MRLPTTSCDSTARPASSSTPWSRPPPAGSGGLNFPSGLIFGPDGNLYVSSVGTNSGLRYNDATGAFIDNFVTTLVGGLDRPILLIFDNDDDLDGVPDANDNCPLVANTNQINGDGDGMQRR